MANRVDLLIEKSMRYRGRILHELSLLELLINEYIAVYFCKEDRDIIREMHLLVLGDERINLNSKIGIFSSIAKNHDTNWYNSYVSLRPTEKKRPPKTMSNDLIYVIEERNIYAHRAIDMFYTFGDDSSNDLVLLRFKNNIEFITIKEEDFEILSNTIRNLGSYLSGHFINKKHTSPL